MKNRKNSFHPLAILVALFMTTNILAQGHGHEGDLVHLTGKYFHKSATQMSQEALAAYDGKDLPNSHNGRKPDFLSHKMRHYRVTINSIRCDAIPKGENAHSDEVNGIAVQKVKQFPEGNELEIMGLIAISPLSSKNNYRQRDGGNDIIFSRDLNGTSLLTAHLDKKTRVNRTKDYYIRNDKLSGAGFRLKFALLEYDKVGTKDEPFKAAHYDVKVGNWNWDSGTSKKYEKRLSTSDNQQVITVFFTVELIKKVSDKEMLDAVCSRNVGHTERLIHKGGNPHAKHLLAYAAKNCDERMIDMLMDYGAKPKAADLQEIMRESNYSKEAVKLLVGLGAVPGDRELQRAIECNQADMVHYFLRNGACPTEKNLRTALKKNQRTIAYKLIDYGAPLSENILELALHQGDIDLVNLILNKGIRPTSKMLVGCVADQNVAMTRCLLRKMKPDRYALMEAANQNSYELFALLIDNGGYLNNNDCINKAIDFNNYEIINLGLRHGGNVNEALNYAIKRNNRSIVMLCLDRGANANLAFPFAVHNNDLYFFNDLLYRYNGNANDGLAAAVKGNHIRMAEDALRTGRANPSLHIKYAADRNNEEMIRMLIDYGADPNPAMLGAVKANNTELVKYLMEKGATATDGDLINQATENGNFVLVELFVENGANPNDGMTCAVKNNHLEITEYLLWKGALVSNYISVPAAKGLKDMVFLLLEYGANPDEAMRKAVENERTEIVKMLLDYGANTNGQLASPAAKGDREMVEILLAGGANPNDGMQAAVDKNQTRIVEMLLTHGARAKGFIETPIARNNREMTLLLLEAGANPNEGMFLAVQKENIEMVKTLLKYGADGSKIDFLKMAVNKKNDRLVTILAEAGTDVNHRFSDGKTIIHLAAFKAYNYPVIRALVDAGVELNVYDRRKNSPLHLAVAIGKENLEVIRLLVENGADVNAVNQEGKSICKAAKHLKVRKYLKKQGAKKKGWG